MHGSDYNELIETALRRKLTADEEARLQAYLADHPDAQAAWEEEMSLTYLLKHLPDAPVSSNFAAQVLEQVGRERAQAARTRWPVGRRLRFSPNWAWQLGFAVLLISFCGLSYHRYRVTVRKEVARSVAKLSIVAALPSLEMLENFEAIKRLNQVPQEVDFELLAALK